MTRNVHRLAGRRVFAFVVLRTLVADACAVRLANPLAPALAVGAVFALFGGCATAGSTIGSGVGDRTLSRPPYYAGERIGAAAGLRIGHVPISYQRGAAQEAMFDPELTPAMEELLAVLTAELTARGFTPLAEPVPGTGPDVHLSCLTDPTLPDECAVSGDTALGRGTQAMRLAVDRPSAEWIAGASAAMDEVGVDRVLVITLEVGQYFVRQRGLAGAKEVELGGRHVVSLPWLTSLETPVSVLQLTGALVGPDGRAIRIGAEGLTARRTPLSASSMGAQALVTEEDVERLLDARREDLPGRPLVWERALRTLAEGLVGTLEVPPGRGG